MSHPQSVPALHSVPTIHCHPIQDKAITEDAFMNESLLIFISHFMDKQTLVRKKKKKKRGIGFRLGIQKELRGAKTKKHTKTNS